jgi:Arc/MetJ-type ribon-helix-helix transcriptional regulator
MRKHLYSFSIDPPLHAALRQVTARTGVSGSEHIRRALRLWLEKQGVHVEDDEQQQHRQVNS